MLNDYLFQTGESVDHAAEMMGTTVECVYCTAISAVDNIRDSSDIKFVDNIRDSSYIKCITHHQTFIENGC